MTKKLKRSFGGGFSRRPGPDVVTEELAVVLSEKASYEFKALFDLVHANLRARNSANGSEEMLRLRAYEKLQALVNQGMVEKKFANGIKEYRGLDSLASALPLIPPAVCQ